MNTDVFISYRRCDSQDMANRIKRELEDTLDDNIRIFLDTARDFKGEALIPLGSNWSSTIQEALKSSRVVLVIIGSNWLTAIDKEKGIRYLEDPNDWVRREIAEAIKEKKILIPILIDDTKIPKNAKLSLPKELHKLPDFQAIWLRREDIKPDIDKVVERIKNEINISKKAFQDPLLEFLDSLEKYEIIERSPIGEGNLAKIYKARDKDMNRIVAIKILRHQDQGMMDAFDKSAKRAVRISDQPHFLTIYDVHLDKKYHYYVRQFIEGQNLRRYIDERNQDYSVQKNQCVPIDEVLKIILKIGKALNRAHEMIQKLDLDYAYTDIKPSNVLLSGGLNSEPFIPSFNICDGLKTKKILNELGKQRKDLDERLFQEELSYLLPDYFYGRRNRLVDYEKADQYRLGLLAYELLTGNMPPTLKSIKELESKGINAFKQIDSIPHADCPEVLKTVILKMISKNPKARYERFNYAVNVFRNLDIDLTMPQESYIRCIKSKDFSNEKFYEIFLGKLKNNSLAAHKLLASDDKEQRINHAQSLIQSILFLFAYFEQNKRFYKNTGRREEPNILSGIAKTHNSKERHIPKQLYKPFGKALIDTIAEFDNEFNDHLDLRDMWQDIYDLAVDYMTSR